MKFQETIQISGGASRHTLVACLEGPERDVSTFTLKTWCTPTSSARIRTGLPYKLAYALAVSGGDYKAQIISRWGIVDLEIKTETSYGQGKNAKPTIEVIEGEYGSE